MNKHLLILIMVGATLFALASGAIFFFLAPVNDGHILYSSEQMDGSEHRVVVIPQLNIGEYFESFSTDTSIVSDAIPWGNFRGKNLDNIVINAPELTTQWNDSGPIVQWEVSLGEGYAAPVVAYHRVYIIDYDEKKEHDALRCFDFETGKELWRRTYQNKIKRNHGKSRTVVAVDSYTVISIGPQGHVMALDAISGDLLWSRDLVKNDGSLVPQWYMGQCPLIDQDALILAVAGDSVLLTALELRTGNVRWETPNTLDFKLSHASVVPMTLEGVEQYVYAALGGTVGISKTGELLWSNTQWKPAVLAPTPVQIAPNKIFLTAGYGAGASVLVVEKNNAEWKVELSHQWKPTQGPASEQQTPIFHQGKLWIIQPKDAGALRAQLVVADPEKLPKIEASSGREHRFGIGPYIFADDKIWILDDEGVLSVYRYSENTFQYLNRFKVLPGVDAWGPIAFAQGRMLVRDSYLLRCIDLRKESYL